MHMFISRSALKAQWCCLALLPLLMTGCGRQKVEAHISAAATEKTVPGPASAVADVEGGAWGTIKGRVVWGGTEVPQPEELKVTINQPQCLACNPAANMANATIPDESRIIKAKNKGFKDVFVYIMVAQGEKIPIHPDAPKPGKTFEVDQPCCMFLPRVTAMREGDIFVVKNTAEIDHNIRWIGDEAAGNQGGNQTLKPGNKHEITGLKAQRLPLTLECNIHGWMKGRLGVFSHPYYAITNEDGNFELKNVPSGTWKLMIYQESVGYRLGAKGKNGEEVTVKGGAVTNMGDLPMGK